MRDFLAAFGLVSSADTARASGRGRSGRARARAHGLDFPTDMLNAEQQDVLRNLGLLPGGEVAPRRTARTMRVDEDQEAAEAARASKEHVFNPSQHLAALRPTPEEVRRLNKLLDTFKKYTKENGSVSEEDTDVLTPAPTSAADESENESTTQDPFVAEESEATTIFPDEDTDSPVTDSPEVLTVVNDTPDVFTVMNDTPESVTTAPKTSFVPLDKVPNAPSPLDLAELIQLLNATKNEVKRQQANATANSTANSTASSSSSTASSSSSTASSGDEDRGASAVDLAASFGGGDDEPVSTQAPSGLYFLLDWNSFLEVGDPESARRVNIRIAPKVGDPRRFLPVTVP